MELSPEVVAWTGRSARGASRDRPGPGKMSSPRSAWRRTPPIAAGTSAPTWARRYVAVFLTAFLVCGVFGFEAWPLTGWRLFADARPRVQPGWRAVVISPGGSERPLPFRDLDAGYQGNVQVLRRFGSLPPADQAAVCDAWADAVRERGLPVAVIRIDQTSTDVGDRRGDRGAPPVATPRWRCQVDQDPAVVTDLGTAP